MECMVENVVKVVNFFKVFGYEGCFMILCYFVSGEKFVIEFEELLLLC